MIKRPGVDQGDRTRSQDPVRGDASEYVAPPGTSFMIHDCAIAEQHAFAGPYLGRRDKQGFFTFCQFFFRPDQSA